MVQLFTALLLVHIASCVLSQDIVDRYVRPDDSSLSSCPDSDKPCLTLEKYASQKTKYFISGATFLFLAGNHNINTSIILNGTSDVTLKANNNNSTVIVLCMTAEHSFAITNGFNLTIRGITFMHHNKGIHYRSIFSITRSKGILFTNSTFFGVSVAQVQALSFDRSELAIMSCIFKSNTGSEGGAISLKKCNASLTENRFQGNLGSDGGALYAEESYLTLYGNDFVENKAKNRGGAIFVENRSYLKFLRGSIFMHNSAEKFGGAVFCAHSNLSIENDTVTEFTSSNAADNLAKLVINVPIERTGIVFQGNVQKGKRGGFGGAVYLTDSVFISLAKNLYFTKNHAKGGGGIYSHKSTCTVSSASFTHNTVVNGGGGIFLHESKASFHNFHAAGNRHTVKVYFSSAHFTGNVTISGNRGKYYGGLLSLWSSINFTGSTVFEGNHASSSYGGAIRAKTKSTISFGGSMLLKGNSAKLHGGAVFTLDAASTISISGRVNFTGNKAGGSGGAMYFESSAKLILHNGFRLAFSNNHAGQYGGALFYSDAATPAQCQENENSGFPPCFIDFYGQVVVNEIPSRISARNNSANVDGSFIFGGLLDKCYVFTQDSSINLYPEFKKIGDISQTRPMSSQPYQLCFCDSNQKFNCDKKKTVETHRGMKFTVSLLALAQGETVTSSPVRAKLSSAARLLPDQRSQYLPRNCTSLTFNMFSSREQENLVLYLDESPCLDTGLSQAVINVTFRPYPDGFTLSGDQCVCEERLQKYNANCTIYDHHYYITRSAGSKFWVSPLYSSNESYQGLILSRTCPTQYCKTDSVNITLLDPDIQCTHDRSGVLCGACAANYSLTFGSSTCEACSNTQLALLLVFAAAGIVLVVFLTLLRLTVATGMINSVILYANIVQADKQLLIPNSSSILKVFIAWLNLDFGFQACFYDGMDAYAQTWLQLAFPVYVWLLISMIILASRYSMTVTKLIGSNPIAVLATLLLMSYTKLLKIIIEVYSSVDLEYPGNKKLTVWLKDANEPYLQSRHLALTVVTTLLLVFLFLPYTLLLLLGYKLYRFTGRKCTRWLTRTKPLLDAYYAPYEKHTRYWTGFLLLVRCALYITFSCSTLRHKTHSLLAIIIAFAAILMCLTLKIYSKPLTNTIEAAVYLNLIVFSSCVAVAGKNSPALSDSLVGIVFTITVGIIIYHFHIFYIAKSALWLKLHAKVTTLRAEPTETTPLLAPEVNVTPLIGPTHSVVSIHMNQNELADGNQSAVAATLS